MHPPQLRTKLVVIGLFFFLVPGLLWLWIWLFCSANTIEVTAADPLSPSKVHIEQGHYSINRANDLEVLNDRVMNRTVYGGLVTRPISTDFGENDFLVLYGSEYYFEFRHFIESDFTGGETPPHQYHFSFTEKDHRPWLEVNITGYQPMHFARPMASVREAAHNLANRPIDSARVIYNMVEMTK